MTDVEHEFAEALSPHLELTPCEGLDVQDFIPEAGKAIVVAQNEDNPKTKPHELKATALQSNGLYKIVFGKVVRVSRDVDPKADIRSGRHFVSHQLDRLRRAAGRVYLFG